MGTAELKVFVQRGQEGTEISPKGILSFIWPMK
jgi:hypothetical protein